MCHQFPSDKGWLRQYIPKPTHDQLHDFIEGVGKRLDHIRLPDYKQIDSARMSSFRSLMGVVA